MHLSIAKDFSDVPWGRYPEDGDYCGENFRERHLVPPLLDRTEKVIVELDGVEGFGSSFLDEAFGGMVRKGYFTADELKARLKVETTQPEFQMYVTLIWRYIAEAKFGSEKQLATA